MEKTRKAFVVLAAAVTAGDLGACTSDTQTQQGLKYADAAPSADANAPVHDTGAVDTRTAKPQPEPDTRPVSTEPDAMLADAGTMDADVPDARAEVIRLDAFVRLDATVSPPDTRPPLTMPAGTAYDVISREQLA